MINRILALVAILATLSGCVTVYSYTEIKHTPSPIQQEFPRDVPTLACTTVAALYDLVDNDIFDWHACSYRPMTAVTYRSSYDSERFGRIKIYQFMDEDFNIFFTFNGGRDERRSRHY